MSVYFTQEVLKKYIPLETDIELHDKFTGQTRSSEEVGRVRATPEYAENFYKLVSQPFEALDYECARSINEKPTIRKIKPSPLPGLIDSLVTLKFMSILFSKLGITIKSPIIQEIQTALQDPQLTLDSINRDFITQHQQFLNDTLQNKNFPITFSWDINNQIFYPEIQQDKITVSEENREQYQFFQNDLFTDTTIFVQENSYNIHRNCLAKKSRYFRTLFTNDISKLQKEIVLDDINLSKNGFNEFLKFVYTDTIDFSKISPNDLYGLTELAQKGETIRLTEECVKEYRRRLTSNTIWETLDIAWKLNNNELKKHCLFFFKAHPKWISKHLDITQFSLEELLDIFSKGQYFDNTELFNLSKKAIGNKLDQNTFVTVANYALNHKDEFLTTMCLYFYETSKKSLSFSPEQKKTYIRLATDMNENELEEIFIPKKSKLETHQTNKKVFE